MILNKLNFSKKKRSFVNRISVSPMCQYSANNGLPSDWHFRHLSNLIMSGAGLLMIESTAVTAKGRISKKDLCIESKKQKQEFKKLIQHLKRVNDIPIGIQLSHSGRKGSSEIPWIKANTPLKKKEAWQTFSSSNLPKDAGWPKPKNMNINEIKSLIKKFKMSIKNSLYANFDILELHMAHGYLLHQFLSPICNNRTDSYGGNKLNRFRLALEIAKIARKIWPNNKILGARITGNDHLKNGISTKEAVEFCLELEKIGFDYVCVSSGGIITKTNMKQKKFFRLDFAKEIKKKTNLKVGITGFTNDLKLADKYIKKNYFDNIFIGRPFLKNPFFLYDEEFLKKKGFRSAPSQYLRGY